MKNWFVPSVIQQTEMFHNKLKIISKCTDPHSVSISDPEPGKDITIFIYLVSVVFMTNTGQNKF